jgi:hypothetical protein
MHSLEPGRSLRVTPARVVINEERVFPDKQHSFSLGSRYPPACLRWYGRRALCAADGYAQARHVAIARPSSPSGSMSSVRPLRHRGFEPTL